MSMNASAYEIAALAKMPYKALTKLSEDPNYVELSKLHRGVYRNCAAAQSLQNGNNGHLGILIPAAKYTTRNGGVAYTATPNHPGTYDSNIAANAGCLQQSQREAKHKQSVDNHMIDQAVQNIIKITLTEVLPLWLLAEMEDRETGLNTVNIHNTFDHAFDRRAQIHDNLVDEYTMLYKSPIDISKGFNTYVEKQEECCDFSQGADQPITDAQL
eukprot:5290331-Ditylum_brightwellii.AAC.1